MDVIVVEGIHDEMRIKSIYKDAFCVITNGREIDDKTISYIKKLSEDNNIIVFTDPDTPGERIRKIVSEAVPNAKQAFLRKKDCISKNHKKVGVEHASKEAIIMALDNVFSPVTKEDTISNNDLFSLGLNGSKESSILRDKISDLLNIGKPNAKTFLRRLNMLQITKQGLEEIICQVK